ncbi:hypothetical protein C8D77_1011709 [Mesorhizobium loti]|jgi:hypothetical protein|uniref:Uncharacterized protein n=1 Tax=Rhizobium loti TaxID=381 RepID=A0A8E2WL81_RHILI|nr:hypothetical protein C8D77_1011709 [Mesorhizobium loti]
MPHAPNQESEVQTEVDLFEIWAAMTEGKVIMHEQP